MVVCAQVFYFEKMEVNDFRNDVLLAEACRADVDKYCKHVEPGVLGLALSAPYQSIERRDIKLRR